MSPGIVRGSHPVDEDGEVPDIPRTDDPAGRMYVIETYDALGTQTTYRAVSWFGEPGVEWLDEPSDLAEETLDSHSIGE